MDEAEYCHRLALMYRGKVIALGTPAELKARADGAQPAEPGIVAIRWRPCGRSKGWPGVRDVAVFGGGLHVTVDDAAATERAIRERAGRRRASKCASWSRSSPRWKMCSWP